MAIPAPKHPYAINCILLADVISKECPQNYLHKNFQAFQEGRIKSSLQSSLTYNWNLTGKTQE